MSDRFIKEETWEKTGRNSQRFSRFKPNKLLTLGVLTVLLLSGTTNVLRADNGMCNGVNVTLPFLDVAGNAFFCQIAAAYFAGLTNGTSATTYSPTNNVTREQMAAFTTRTLDQSLKRGSQRAALDQFWTTRPHYNLGLGVTNLSSGLRNLKSDGKDIWVANENGLVYRVSGSDGKLLGTWTGADYASGVVCAMGRIYVVAHNGELYQINPAAAPGAVTTVASGLASIPKNIAFDGNRFWTANNDSISIITPGPSLPWNVTNVPGLGVVEGIIYDGNFIWVTGNNSLKKLNFVGTAIQTVPVGTQPFLPAFDGTNIWVPARISHEVYVVRAATGEVVATLSGNGLNGPIAAAFDGERILVTNQFGHSVSLWKATDLTPLGNRFIGADTEPLGVCSDGQYFWITLRSAYQLVRF
jgi:outer membrane protein assembly factor BamB